MASPMRSSEHTADVITEVLHSPALHQGSLVVSEPVKKARLFGGTRFKDNAAPVLYWFVRKAPRRLALWVGYCFVRLITSIYWIPRSPLRLGCQYMSTLCNRAGNAIAPGQILREFRAHARLMYRAYYRLYRDGWEAVIGHVELREEDRKKFQEQIERYGGAIMVVPHNWASAFSGLKFSKSFPTLLSSKNSSSIQRTKLALEFFERMDVKVLMVRGGSSVQTSRALFRALRSGHVVAATVDTVSGPNNSVPVQIFGQTVNFPDWAARIAGAVGVPLVAVYVRCEQSRVSAVVGDPIMAESAGEAAQAYATFFEENILADPANWPFFADRKWRRVLKAAVSETQS